MYCITHTCVPISASKVSWLFTNYACGKAYGLLFVASLVQFTEVFSAKLHVPAVLICQTSLPTKFLLYSSYNSFYTYMSNTFTDLSTVTNIRNTSTICVTYFDISWDAPSITCGDVYYEVLISQSQIEGEAVEVLNVTGLNNSFLSVIGLDNNLPDVTITVTAIDRVGRRNGSMYSVQFQRSLGMYCP